ncbi:Peptidase C14, caspase catalytic subunit p20 [Rubellimicrobium mesophilum DSM 19309]|uniref:Peptidase C14, caspase catalytic subunit p20 n=1 Tax=Rubellimicrobium mesophilum DSM 19309 TaxID=442562 RepID=A0A017HST0_9RHOB|nr:caspase family protein [Rubellimicrobium mesophilum]EYD77436.1 Peptidase C14, caspase catalytic subunit p20 [Rubellimicrobium mesophilum DSM 19309]
MSIRTRLIAALPVVVVTETVLAEDRALVVGIDGYATLDQEAALGGAVADAWRFRDFLISHRGFTADQVTLLTNDEANAEAITSAVIDELIGKTLPGERAVFYFAGMGTRTQGDDGPVLTLLAHDTESLLGHISEDFLGDLLDLIPDRMVTVVVDASFDGLPGLSGRRATRGLPSDSPDPAEELYGTGTAERDVWNAAAPGGLAWEESGAGLFTSAFIAGLATQAADGNGDGHTTNGELLDFLRDWTAGWCGVTPDCAAAGRETGPGFAGRTEEAVLPPEALAAPDAERLAAEALTWRNPAHLDLSFGDSGVMHVGDTRSLRIGVQRAGWLELLDVNPQGELVRLGEGFPISPSDGGAYEFRFRVTEPTGRGLLIAILVENGTMEGGTMLSGVLEDGPARDEIERLQAIARILLRQQTGPNGAEIIDWSSAALPYEIGR